MLPARAVPVLGALALLAALAPPAASVDLPPVPVYLDAVYLAALNFVPPVTIVESGRTALWHHGELATPEVLHTVTADDGSFHSGPMYLHMLFTVDIDLPAGSEVLYHCTFHDGMAGKLIVT